MDLIKILENIPVGTILYSIVHGELYYKGLDLECEYPIRCRDSHNNPKNFTKDGKWLIGDGECILFPSKDNRNWNDFIKNILKPFDKVLVRDGINDSWELSFFAYIDEYGKYCTINGARWVNCIPYEGNEHLLGVIEKP